MSNQLVTPTSHSEDVALAVEAARAAGAIVRGFYLRDDFAVIDKADGSPVTDADLAADREIRHRITARFPNDAMLTEESKDDPARPGARRCWIVDPIDGTAQFIARTGRFDVVICLVVDGRPVVAAICHPPTGHILAAVVGGGAWLERDGQRQPVTVPPPRPDGPIRIAGSIWFGYPSLESELARIIADVQGESAPVLPTGIRPIELLDADRPFDAVVGPIEAIDRTYGGEWDFAAPDLIISEAGGAVSNLLGEKHRYNKPMTRNGGGLIYACNPATHARIVRACAAGVPRSIA